MDGKSAIRRGRFRNRLIAALVPTFLLSGLPAVACSCSVDQVSADLLSTVVGHASFCRCKNCPGQSGGEGCCCKPQTNRRQSNYRQSNRPPAKTGATCCTVQQSSKCIAVLRERLLTSSASKVTDDLSTFSGAEVAVLYAPLADSHAFWQPTACCDTGPPPLDLVVSLRRFLI
jgi:hypothetical protein